MRLIDADALMKAMYHRAFETDGDTMWQSGCWVRYRAVEQTVREQPTVDAVLVVRCKDCRWWDKYGDYDNGYCMAAKHRHWSKHWEISIRRTYKGDFYCADAEPKEEQE